MRTGLFARAMMLSGAFLVFGGVCFGLGFDSSGHLADEIINVTGIRGGLVVHVGCGGGELTAAFRVNERYIVHGIDTSAENISEARAYIQKRGVYGPVSVDTFDGTKLPYADNMVNLVVSEGLGDVPMDEVMRVLCPEGKAYIRAASKLTVAVKPRPDEIDEWTHYLHDSSNNAVAHDKLVAPPRHVQWVGSPRWSRHHDRMASMSALVSSGGRVFYIFDEGPLESIQLPPERYLIARDAFNGVVLWKQPIPSWHTHLWPYKTGHAQLPRRLVAVGDVVYATLGHEVPLVALDAATGEILWTCEESESTEEVIASDGTLFILATDEPIKYAEYEVEHLCMHKERNHLAEVCTWDERERRIMAVDAGTGEVLWEASSSVVPLTLAADGRGVFFHDGERVVRLDRDSGEEMWASGEITRKPTVPTNFGATLVIADDAVLFSGGDRAMSSVAIDDGRTLWVEDHPPSGHNSPEDLLVIDGLVWAGAIANGRDSGVFTGRDPFTGEVKKEFGPDIDTYWFHHRCHRAKATDRFLMPSRTGIEYVDHETEHWETNHWVRGGCIYGVMPCNGLTYAPPHSCSCYIDAKLNGFCALAGESQRASVENTPDSERLIRGEAYGKIKSLGYNIDYSGAWPTYRRDSRRSGYTRSAVPVNLKDDWQTKIGGRLSSPVVAEGRVFVASIDRHAVYALDEAVGRVLWSYTAGGRVDSPPTIYRGQAIFGCADGWVYCLRVRDGALVWRYQAAPADRRVMAFEQVESVWPVSGSVLVENGVVYCVAGRSMFLDGGMRLLRLDVATGKKISETVLDEIDPETGENLQTRLNVMNMPTALPDVLSSDGRHVYMRTQRFDMKG
ncbi:MAG: PQQ-binding-like beta-propeller repeat protein, partial [Planctomycetes bacterium]|nr:PQQ-binding-like beta-propeller repeat protein [Planctomycetota bacterium]